MASSSGSKGQAPIDIAAVIDARPLTGFQKWIMVLVAASVIMDGFDVQAMGFVAPAIVKDWGVSKALLGPVFGAGLVGMLIGSLVLSTLADRVGRRPVLIGSTLFFATCMLGTTLVQDIPQLLIARLITGVGLGGVMANAIALVVEFSPRRRRVSLMMWVSCGFTAGAVLGGVVSAGLIPIGGWRSVFLVGGIVPIVIAMLMWRHLPESMHFLVLRDRDLRPVVRCLTYIAPDLALSANTKFQVHEAPVGVSPVRALFQDGRAKFTLLLWIINFMNLLDLFFLANWLPTLIVDSGYPQTVAVLIGTLLQVGGVVGTVAMGPLIDRWGFYKVLVPSFLVAVITIAAMGQPGLPMALLLVVVATAGFCVVGGQPAVNALAATVYPTSSRATGVGWSLGVGRAGSIAGPLLAGQLIAWKWSVQDLFLVAALPALLSCLMVLLMSRSAARRKNVDMQLNGRLESGKY
jgi:AAHS family 4-hydroxybenzoate transporter-like MFS transporter